MSKNVDQLVEELSSLTVLEMSQLKKLLEDKWGVKAQAAAVVAMPQAGAAAPAEGGAATEATEFDVLLQEVPADKKMGAIKALREVLPGLGLKEAKEAVEGAPKVVKEKAPKAEAEEIKKKLESAGAKVTLKAA